MNTILILMSVTLSAIAHMIMKAGMKSIVASHGNLPIAGLLIQASLNSLVLLGVVLYVGALAIWLYVLAHLDVSYAYPFISLGFVLVLFLSHFFLSEPLSTPRVIGTALIVIGVLVVSRS